MDIVRYSIANITQQQKRFERTIEEVHCTSERGVGGKNNDFITRLWLCFSSSKGHLY